MDNGPIFPIGVLEARRKVWGEICEKYEKRGQLNSSSCYFNEVHYKLFMKSFKSSKKIKEKRYKKKVITISSISSDSEDSGVGTDRTDTTEKTSDSIDCSTSSSGNSSEDSEVTFETVNTKSKDPESIIFIIEEKLKSNLNKMLVNRNVSNLLESDDYNYWHKCTKLEMTRLLKYISKADLMMYMKYCHNRSTPKDIPVEVIQDIIVQEMKSNLRNLFIKREFVRNDAIAYQKCLEKIHEEWQRLLKEIPRDYLVLYASSVLYSIKRAKQL